MKILHKATETEWWVGVSIKCDCGFEAVLESGDDGCLTKYPGFIDYRCDCGRLISRSAEDVRPTIIGVEMTDSGYGTRIPVEIKL